VEKDFGMKMLQADNRYGVPRINIYLLRALYSLMFVFLGYDAWSHILTFDGTWEPRAAAAWSVWAAYSLLALLGLRHPLRMLPIILLEIVYKGIWLVVVAFPLWSAGKLAGSPAEEMTYSFLWVVLPILATPWRYVFETYFRRERGAAGSLRMTRERDLSYEGGSS
jgi:hypothetical protein